MVTIGATYLNDGVWDGQQVIPPDWVTASVTPYAGNTWTNHLLRPIPPDDNTWGRRGYAYAWWTHEFRRSGHTVPTTTPRAESHDSGPACREDRQVSRSASRLMLSIILRLITKLTTSSGKRPNTSRLVQSGP